MILFTKMKASHMCSVVTMDVNDAESKVRSCYSTMDVTGSNQRQSDDEKIQILDIPRGGGGGI